MWTRVYLFACMTTEVEIRLKREYLKSTTNPLKIPLEWPVARLGGQDNSLWKEVMRTITSKSVTVILPLCKRKITGHIHHSKLLPTRKTRTNSTTEEYWLDIYILRSQKYQKIYDARCFGTELFHPQMGQFT